MSAGIVGSELDFVILLTLSVVIAIAVKKYIKVPYTIALVLFGIIISFFNITHIELTKEMIFFFFLPPLLFEGAIHFDANHLKENLKVIGSLAFFGIIITTAVIGLIVNHFLGIPLLYALLFGAIIAPTDPISVLALFKKLGVDKKLSVIVEGESIFNDGTGIVMFIIILGLIETGTFSLTGTIQEFIVVSLGGLAVGLIIGYFAYQFCRSIEDNTIEVLITLILAYASFIIAEHFFHVSGVMAVVAGGMLMGNTGKRLAMGPSVRIAINSFWEIVAFIINSLIFILIGLQIPIVTLVNYWYYILIGILAVIAARSVAVYGILFILNLSKSKLDKKWFHIINWGGIHGSVPVALILGLPAILYKEEISAMVYGGVLFSLVVQGFTMAPIINSLGIIKKSEKKTKYQYLYAKRVALNQTLDEIRRMHREGRISDEKLAKLDKEISSDLKKINANIDKIDDGKHIFKDRYKEIKEELLMLKKNIYMELANDGGLDEDNLHKLVFEVDSELDRH
ncbi:MAG: Na+/H+ antiporter [archaeon]